MKNLTDRIQENNLSTVLGIVITEIIEYYFLSKDYFLNKYGVNQDDLEELQKHLFFQMRAAKKLRAERIAQNF